MPVSRSREAELQAALVAAWEGTPIGTEVIVRKDAGIRLVKTRTLSGPKLLGGHTAVIWLEGISGCYSLERVRKA